MPGTTQVNPSGPGLQPIRAPEKKAGQAEAGLLEERPEIDDGAAEAGQEVSRTMIARLVEIGDPPLANRLAGAAFDLTETAAGVGFRGPDPYDALWWPWPRPLVAGRRRRQALIQLHARSPIDVRVV